MTVDENMLLAFVDGELSAAESARVEAAMAQDPALARRVAAERALRATLNEAFAAELKEPLPQALVNAVRQHSNATSSSVVDMQAARDARDRKSDARVGSTRLSLRFGAIAASLVAGLIGGYLVGRSPESSLTQSRGGQLLAVGSLAAALTQDLSADAAATAPVRIGFSYRSKAGDICRTFKLTGGALSSGIACRRGSAWQVEMMTSDEAVPGEPAFRTAGSSVSASILRRVEEQIQGEPLDRAQESAARSQDWRAGSK